MNHCSGPWSVQQKNNLGDIFQLNDPAVFAFCTVWNVNVTPLIVLKDSALGKPLVELQEKKILQNLSSSHQMSLLSSSTLHKKKYAHNLPIFRHFEIVFNTIKYVPNCLLIFSVPFSLTYSWHQLTSTEKYSAMSS